MNRNDFSNSNNSGYKKFDMHIGDNLDNKTFDTETTREKADDIGKWVMLVIILVFLVIIVIIGIVLIIGVFSNDEYHGGIDKSCSPSVPDENAWLFEGRDLKGTTNNFFSEVAITPSNVNNLTPKCEISHLVGVSGTPTFKNGLVYYTSWDGYLVCINEDTCKKEWEVKLEDVSGFNGTLLSRNAPAIGTDRSGGELVTIADLNTHGLGCQLYAFNRFTGSLVWKTLLSNVTYHIGTMSQSIHNNVVLWGLASNEVVPAGLVPNFTCCTSVGMYGAADLSTGEILWSRSTINVTGFSGGGVWQGPPAIDREEDTAYFVTGQAYSAPQSAFDCLATGTPYDCLPAGVDTDSIIKVKMHTGEIIWKFAAQGLDVWNLDCFAYNANGNCPQTDALGDYDFAGGVKLIYHKDSDCKAVFGVQKSGVGWLINAKTGEKIKNTLIFGYVGSTLAPWGYAYDENTHSFYVPSPNVLKRSYYGLDNKKYCDGAWARVDAETLETLWITPVPGSRSGSQCGDVYRDQFLDHIEFDVGGDTSLDPVPTTLIWDYFSPSNPQINIKNAHGHVAVANGVVFGTSTDGYVYALNMNNGNVLWSFDCDVSIYGGVSVGTHNIKFGCGYGTFTGSSFGYTGAVGSSFNILELS